MNQKGQTFIEALFVLPATVLLFTTIVVILLNSIQLTYLNDIAEEALICARERKNDCKQIAAFKLKQVGYKYIDLEIKNEFQKKQLVLRYFNLFRQRQTIERWIASD